MDGTTLRILWLEISKKYDIGTYEDFKVAMNDPNRRRKFFNNATSNNLDLGTFEEFEKKIMGTDQLPVVKSKPLYFDKNVKDKTPTKPCNDFPFALGCINSKIGDLNAKLFMGNRYNDVYNEELYNIFDNTGAFNSTNPNKELTQKIWDYYMKSRTIKESVKKVLKEYINKKK